jgi:hypothetical protein
MYLRDMIMRMEAITIVLTYYAILLVILLPATPTYIIFESRKTASLNFLFSSSSRQNIHVSWSRQLVSPLCPLCANLLFLFPLAVCCCVCEKNNVNIIFINFSGSFCDFITCEYKDYSGCQTVARQTASRSWRNRR